MNWRTPRQSVGSEPAGGTSLRDMRRNLPHTPAAVVAAAALIIKHRLTLSIGDGTSVRQRVAL